MQIHWKPGQSMLALAHFFLSPVARTMPGVIRATRNYQEKQKKRRKRNALIYYVINESVCRTYPGLGNTLSGFLYRSIHYIVTENQLQLV